MILQEDVKLPKSLTDRWPMPGKSSGFEFGIAPSLQVHIHPTVEDLCKCPDSSVTREKKSLSPVDRLSSKSDFSFLTSGFSLPPSHPTLKAGAVFVPFFLVLCIQTSPVGFAFTHCHLYTPIFSIPLQPC